ncbi:hypothetical protein D3C73_1265070 [compost metagenome]
MGGARKSTPKRLAPSVNCCRGLARRRVAISATSAVEINTSSRTIKVRGVSSSPQLRDGAENVSHEPSDNSITSTYRASADGSVQSLGS